MSVRRLCLTALLISSVAGCSMYKDWFGAAKSEEAETPVKRNLDFAKKRETREDTIQAD